MDQAHYWRRGYLGFSDIVLKVNSGFCKIRVLSSGTLSQTLDLDSQLHVDRRMCCQLRWTLSVINW